MTIQPRPFSAALLALLLALTSVQMALARGQAAPAGTIVLCTGTGPRAVAVDAEGAPVGPAHICPDCALSLFAVAEAGGPEISYVARLIVLSATQTPRLAPVRRPLRPAARDPPAPA